MTEKAITYTTDAGAEVKLSPGIIRRFLVNGQGNVSDQEVTMFLMLCKSQRLNPFLREAYLIKFGSEKATMVVGKEVFTKRAENDESYRGFRAGVIVQDDTGNVVERVGSFVLPSDDIVGGWAEVHKAGRDIPYKTSVAFAEYVGKKKDGTPNKQWTEKPATMIRKVALVQALREAFPDTFSGLYDQAEMSQPLGDVNLDETEVKPEVRDVTPEQKDENQREGTPDHPDGTSADEPAQPEDKSKQEMLDGIGKTADGVEEDIF